MRQALAYILSPLSLTMVALPMVAWLFFAVYVVDVPYKEATGTVTVRLFFLAVMALVFFSALYSFRKQAYAQAVIQAGIALLLCQLAALHVWGFSGKLSIGVGEIAPQFAAVDAGLLASAPAVPIALVTAQTGTVSSAGIVIDSREQKIALGQTIAWRDYDLRLTTVSHAPLLVLGDLRGKELDAGYIKLNPESTEPNYFQFSINPHRIYAAPASWKGEAWKKEGDRWMMAYEGGVLGSIGDDPETLVITIMRGKLRITGGEIKRGALLTFNEYSVRFEKGLPWIEFTVRKRPSLIFLYAGIALVVLGAAIRLRARRPA